MAIISRIRRMIPANINSLMEKAEDKAQDVRRKNEILIARKRSAQAHQSLNREPLNPGTRMPSKTARGAG